MPSLTLTLRRCAIDGDGTVPAGVACTSPGVEIDGSLAIDRLVRVVSTGGSVDGNVQSDGTQSTLVDAGCVDGDLQCKGNGPAPTGGDDVVRMNAEDHCSGLVR